MLDLANYQRRPRCKSLV